jgi:hypothetical protein
MASGAIDPDKAQNDLETVLKVNDALWPVDKMRDFHGIDMRSRWQGDFLMALFRILQTNPWMAGMILNPTTSAEKRVQRSLLADFWTQSVAGGMAGPKGFSNHANREASNDSRTMAVSEYRRSYYVAKAVVRTVNHGRRSHRLLAPLPMAGDEAFIIEDYDDE